MPHRGPLGFLGSCAEWDASGRWFTYFIAVEKAPGTTYPEGTRSLAVPAATYAMFPSVGPLPQTLPRTWKQATTEWFPTSGYDHAGSPDFEVYPAFPPGDERGVLSGPRCYAEVWIPLRKRG